MQREGEDEEVGQGRCEESGAEGNQENRGRSEWEEFETW